MGLRVGLGLRAEWAGSVPEAGNCGLGELSCVSAVVVVPGC